MPSGIHPFVLCFSFSGVSPSMRYEYKCVLCRHLARWGCSTVSKELPCDREQHQQYEYSAFYGYGAVIVFSFDLFFYLHLGGAFSGIMFTKLAHQQCCPTIFTEKGSVRQHQGSIPRIEGSGYRSKPDRVLDIRRSPPLQKQRHKLGSCCLSATWICSSNREHVQRGVGSLVGSVTVTSGFQ